MITFNKLKKTLTNVILEYTNSPFDFTIRQGFGWNHKSLMEDIEDRNVVIVDTGFRQFVFNIFRNQMVSTMINVDTYGEPEVVSQVDDFSWNDTNELVYRMYQFMTVEDMDDSECRYDSDYEENHNDRGRKEQLEYDYMNRKLG